MAALAVAFGICFALSRCGPGGNGNPLDILPEIERVEKLKQHLEANQSRDAAKRSLAAEVVAKKISLRVAAGHFRGLDEADPFFPPGIPRTLGNEWFFCESVLDYVWIVVADQKRYATGARYYDEAFRAEPQFLAEPLAHHRYRAACAAAMAGCGQGRDAAEFDDKIRTGFRRQAREWLRDELEARRRLMEREPETIWTVVRTLRDWLGDNHFAGVRGPDALAKLPAAERQAWQKLWEAVADTVARAKGTTPPKPTTGSKIALPER
jgi:hypothetical protein